MPAPGGEATRPRWAARERADFVQVADEHLVSVLAAMAGADDRAHADQARAVDALVVDQARVQVVQATGWGKSAVYWAATSAIRSLGGGPTLVVSPLLALMRDQLTAAERAGLHAVTINSNNVDDWDQILADIRAGTVDVLLVSPERLANPGFARTVDALVASAGLIVIRRWWSGRKSKPQSAMQCASSIPQILTARGDRVLTGRYAIVGPPSTPPRKRRSMDHRCLGLRHACAASSLRRATAVAKQEHFGATRRTPSSQHRSWIAEIL